MPLVTGAAAAGLAAIANRDAPASGAAVRALVETLRDPVRRGDGLNALARLAAPAIPELAKALASDDPHIRRGAVEALEPPDPSRWPPRRCCARSEMATPRSVRLAIMGLSRIGTRGLGRRLSLLARSDPSASVRQAATAALHRYRDSDEGNE